MIRTSLKTSSSTFIKRHAVYNNGIRNPAASAFSLQSTFVVQQRNYIFFPSLQEIKNCLSDFWNTKKENRRTILVKLVQNQTEAVRSTYKRKKRRRKLRNQQWRQRLAESQATWAAHSKARWASYRGKWQERYQLYSQKLQQAQPLRITLSEYSKADWFDKDGYPQTSRDPRTGRFVNPWNSESTNGSESLLLFLRWRMERFYKNWATGHDSIVPNEIMSSSSTTPLVPTKDKIQLTWIGHSTTMVHMEEFVILTDPHFSQRAFFTQVFGGVVRDVQPSQSIQSLPSIDVCCISHDHYDHLDYDSVCELRQKVQWWVVPLGIKQWLETTCDVPANQVVELAWWQKACLKRNSDKKLNLVTDNATNKNQDTLAVTCTPAQHWCSRTPFDRNARLWCSFAICTPNLKFYFGGDTGLPKEFPLHKQIGTYFGGFDLAALPIGAYEPQWFMRNSHISPPEAVQIHTHLNSKKSVAIHWGTFPLADEDADEPPKLLRQSLEPEMDFVVLNQGESTESASYLERDDTMNEEESYDDDERPNVGYG